MRSHPYMPGVPAAGHIVRGYWHPGREEGCPKCRPAPPVPRPAPAARIPKKEDDGDR